MKLMIGKIRNLLDTLKSVSRLLEGVLLLKAPPCDLGVHSSELGVAPHAVDETGILGDRITLILNRSLGVTKSPTLELMSL